MKEKSKYNVLEMKDYILSKASFSADTAIILGSGMGAFADGLNNLKLAKDSVIKSGAMDATTFDEVV